MKLKMAPNSLFAILLRSPWWASLAIAVALALLARALLPERFAVAGMLGAFPFVVIAAIAAVKQSRLPSAAQTAALLEQLNAMSARDFGAAVERAYRAQGYEVRRLNAAGAELELLQKGRRTLVALRRWKAAKTGVEPLRELHEAQLRHDAETGIYLAGGELGDKARAFAAQHQIQLMSAQELLQLMHRSGALARR